MPVYKVGDETFQWKEFPSTVMEQIRLDVLNGITVENSTLTYTPDMLAYRKYFNAWRLSLPEGAVVDFPTLL